LVYIIERIENILDEMNLSIMDNNSFIISYLDEDSSSEGFGNNIGSLEIISSIFVEGLYWNYYENKFYNFDKNNKPLHYGGIFFPNNCTATKKLFDETKNYKFSKTKQRILKNKGIDYNIVEPTLYNIVVEKYIFNAKKVDALLKNIENMHIYIGGGWFNGYLIIYSKNIKNTKQDIITKLELNSIK